MLPWHNQLAYPSPNPSPPSGRVCPVCGGPSNGFFFGVPSCRACASFFRRSALERRQYVCRRTNNCTIGADGMRNSCRACRLRRCIDAGMSAAKNENAPVVSTAVCAPKQEQKDENADKLNVFLSIDLCSPFASRFAQSFRNFENGQQALLTMMDDEHPQGVMEPTETKSTPPSLRLITRDEHLKMQRAGITLKYALVLEHFPGFDALKIGEKIDIFKTFVLETSFFRISELTLRFFPQKSTLEHLVITSTGCAIDRNRLEIFLAHFDKVETYIEFMQPILDKWFNFILCRFKPLDVSWLEMGAMMGIQLWNCVERHVPLSPEQCAQRNALFVELHSMVAQRCGANAAAIATRFGLLLALLQEVTCKARDMEELFTMAKIFFTPVGHWTDALVGMFERSEKSLQTTKVEQEM